MRYSVKMFRQTNKSFVSRFPKWWEGVMQFLVQTLLIFFLLLLSPWFGSFAIEAKAALIGFISVTSSLSLLYLIDLFLAPSRIDKDQLNEIHSLRDAIREVHEVDKFIRELSQLYQEGYRIEGDKGREERWMSKVEDYIRTNLDAATLHRFETAKDTDGVLSLLNRLIDFPSSHVRGYLVNPLLAQKELWEAQSPRYSDNTGTWADLKRPD